VVESTSDYWRPFVYLLQAHGLLVWLVNARDVKQVPGRPKTDRLDAVWLGKLSERGMLRPSFIPPAEIRRLRDLTRLRGDLTEERSRHKQRLEKLLEDALIKLGTVATDLFGVSGRAMLEALIAGERNPVRLAELARGRLRVKRAALVEALTGQFSDHYAPLARILLDQIDGLTAQIDRLTTLIEEAIAAIPAARHQPVGPTRAHRWRWSPAQGPLPAVQRLDEVPGIGSKAAQVIIAELGLDMGQPPRATWSPGPRSRRRPSSLAPSAAPGRPARQPVPAGHAREVAAAAAKTDTFLGERYRRLVRRRGKLKALVAIARSILVIVGTYSPTPPPASATWAPTTTPAASTRAARPAAWSASSRPSATPSPCNPPHNPDRPRADHIPPQPTTRLRCAPPGAAACPLRWSFSGQGRLRWSWPASSVWWPSSC
jgi:transposase